MTVMDPRPWSPAGPHVGPDDDDLLLLEGTGDPEADLGSAVLAVHRVGAAACEAVSRAPLPDGYRLIDALARARAGLASTAVEAVAKCVVSDNPTGYADLLLRDLFNAGENGAMAVYRACVSKGVAPPLAVQRAGMVYGVPHDELGRYLTVAANPKSHPVAIVDAADRAVTHWAAGVVRAEMADGEVVSKQTAVHPTLQEYNTTPFGQEHPKGRHGLFVPTLERPAATTVEPTQVAGRPVGILARLRRDNGLGEQAAPEVATAPAAPVTAPPQPTPVRVQRQQRAQRQQRVMQTPQQSQAKASLKSTLKSKLTASLSSRVKARLDAQRLKPSGKERLPADISDDDVDVSLEFRNRLQTYLAWSMPIEQASEIFRDARGAGTPDSPKTVKMGQLQRILAEPIVWGEQHNAQMRNIAEDAASDEQPKFIHLDADELDAAGVNLHGDPAEVERAVWDYVRMAGYDDQLAREGSSGTLNPMLKATQSIAPSATPGTFDWYLVMNPEHVVYSRPEDQPVQAAAEFIVSDPSGNTARLNIEGGRSALSYELDPTQDWVIKEPVQLWKQTGYESGHWVDRYTLEPVESWNEGKAVATEQRWRTEPRNAVGEWSRTGGGVLARLREPTQVVTPVVTPIQPRAQRRQRAQRQLRTAAPAQAPLATTAQSRLKVEPLSAPLSAALTAAQQARMKAEPKPRNGFPLTLDDRPIHRLLTSREWASFLGRNAPQSFADDVRGIELPTKARAEFAEQVRGLSLLDGDQVNQKMRWNVMRQIDEDPLNRLVEIQSFRRTVAPNDHEAMQDLLDEIEGYMDGNPDVAHVQIGRDPEDGPWDLRVYRNLMPVSDQVLIYTDDDIDWSRPVTLVWIGKTRRDDLNRGREQIIDPANPVDAPVSVYRAQQRSWRAHQDER